MKKEIGGAILAFAFIFGVSAVAGSSVQAQYRNDRNSQSQRGDRNRGDSQDQNRNWRRDSRDNNVYRNDRNVYGNGNYGNRDWRRDNRDNNVYRNDRNSIYNNGNYGNRNGNYNNGYQVALNQGYQVGLNTGASDAQRG